MNTGVEQYISQTAGQHNQSVRHSGNILVVDDNLDNLRLLNGLLAKQGYQIRPVSQGNKAIAAARSKPPDIILLDIMMPGMDGYMVCKALKADERTRDIPVIFISALHETFDKIKAFALGGVDYITKPFQTDEVLARIATHLTLRHTQQALEAEIVIRKQVEKALQHHNQELALLNTMSSELQTCRTEHETYQIVIHACQHLIPESSGYLYILDDTRKILEAVGKWENPPSECQRFDIESLDLVYPEHIEIIERPDVGSIFSRIGYSPENMSLCIPIYSSGAFLAMLAFYFKTAPKWVQLIEAKQRILKEIVEHYALALVNLRLRETLRQESIHDPLTGLYNRRHMEASLEREACRAKRQNSSVGIMLCDIDHFKRFNDTYGHDAGDVVLQEFSKLVRFNIRGEDMACRYGGEEFLLILPDASLKVTKTRARDLLQKVRELEIPYQETYFQITISIGVAILLPQDADIQQIVAAADAALYQAKRKGRDRMVVFP